MSQHKPVHLSVKDACARHNLSRSGLYLLMGAGKVIARKRGSRTLIDVASLDAHFAGLPLAEIKAPQSAASTAELAANESVAAE